MNKFVSFFLLCQIKGQYGKNKRQPKNASVKKTTLGNRSYFEIARLCSLCFFLKLRGSKTMYFLTNNNRQKPTEAKVKRKKNGQKNRLVHKKMCDWVWKKSHTHHYDIDLHTCVAQAIYKKIPLHRKIFPGSRLRPWTNEQGEKMCIHTSCLAVRRKRVKNETNKKTDQKNRKNSHYTHSHTHTYQYRTLTVDCSGVETNGQTVQLDNLSKWKAITI